MPSMFVRHMRKTISTTGPAVNERTSSTKARFVKARGGPSKVPGSWTAKWACTMLEMATSNAVRTTTPREGIDRTASLELVVGNLDLSTMWRVRA
eukprot:scaffold132273_cov37-Tisochrysis_lutea.AAC.1